MRLITFAAAFALLAGCVVDDGAKVVEGTDLTLGMSLPYSEGSETMAVINYLTGFRLNVAENSRCEMVYRCAETNDYLWGAATTRIQKYIKAKVEPCEADQTEEGAAETPDAPEKTPAKPETGG